jgi:hypothetical protein
MLEKGKMLKKILLFLFLGIVSFTNTSWKSIENHSVFTASIPFESYSHNLYEELNATNLKYEAFEYALKGYLQLAAKNELKNSNYLTIIDMSLSSNSDRFFLIDMNDKKVVHQSKVAHGQNSGVEFAKYFSNKISSHQTSLGFYKTAETYHGKHGLSLRLDGLEFSNSNARTRAIVIHSADYANDNFIKKNGRLGRSYGCPSLPEKDYEKIISRIKLGSALFIYYPNPSYLKKSLLANSKIEDLDISTSLASN